MTFHDLTRELRWIEEAEDVIRELEFEQPDGEELTALNELRLDGDGGAGAPCVGVARDVVPTRESQILTSSPGSAGRCFSRPRWASGVVLHHNTTAP